jgi:hypothetical protein
MRCVAATEVHRNLVQAGRDDIRQLVALAARSSRPSQGEGEINESIHQGEDGVFSPFTPRGLSAPA